MYNTVRDLAYDKILYVVYAYLFLSAKHKSHALTVQSKSDRL